MATLVLAHGKALALTLRIVLIVVLAFAWRLVSALNQVCAGVSGVRSTLIVAVLTLLRCRRNGATWNWSNHFEHGWGNFTPFVDGGVGNTIPDTRFFHRPLMTFGYNASFEAGTEVDAGPFSLTASAYDVAPWGPQTVISRVFRCTAGTKCVASRTSTNRRGYTQTSIQSGSASLTRDNGFNAGLEVKPRPYLDLEVDYSRSVPLQLNNFSFGISVDIGSVLRSGPQH